MEKPSSSKTNIFYLAFVAVLVLLCCLYFYGDTITLFPSFIHAWTQSDRLAIAMNFQENGFNFFHPATFNLMTKHGITQVDFPIHEYVVAIISSMTSLKIVSVFRFYNLIYSLVGLYFLCRLTFLFSASAIKSFFIAFFVFTLPFYAFYQTGFLPSVPSFANLFIGLYFLFKYNKDESKKHLYIGITFIALAALARMPFTIFFLASALVYCSKWYQSKKINFTEFIPLALGFSLIIGYYFYNRYLSSQYGTMFLQHLLPITSFSHLIEVLSTFLDRWSSSLFGISHIIFAAAILFIGVLAINKNASTPKIPFSFVLFILISTLGVLAFFLLMGTQYIDHDYYLIDTFLPLLVLMLIVCMTAIEIPQKMELPTMLFFSILSLAFIVETKSMQNERYEIPYNDRVNFAYQKYASSAELLNDWKIGKQDTILFIGTNSTNIPLAVWDRKGYTVMTTSRDSIKSYLNKPFQYAVLLDTFKVSDVLKNYSEIIYRLDRKFEHDGLAVYTPSKNTKEVGFFNSFIDYKAVDFETPVEAPYASNTKIKYPNDSSSLSLHILPIHKFSLSYKKVLANLDPNFDLHVVVQADYLNHYDSSAVNLVCQYGDQYSSKYFASELKDSTAWQNLQSHFVFPAEKLKSGEELSIYYWNSGKSELFVDNYSLLIFQ